MMVQHNQKLFLNGGLTLIALVLSAFAIYFLINSGQENPTPAPNTDQSAQEPKESDHTWVISNSDTVELPSCNLNLSSPSAVSDESLTVDNAVGPENEQDANRNIKPGAGIYILPGGGKCNQRRKLAPYVCFNANVLYWDNYKAELKGNVFPLSDIRTELNINEADSEDKIAIYLKSIQDTKHSMSLNYFYCFVRQNVAVQILDFGVAALNELGRINYRTCNNSSFQSLCGNEYIQSYYEGSLLISTLTIKFNSADAKKKFNEEAGNMVGDSIGHAAAVIKKTVQKLKISGSITTHALQIGGEPSRLSRILKRISAGYYALTCDLTAINDCIMATACFWDYAQDFSDQHSTPKGANKFVPLGVAFTTSDKIDLIGLPLEIPKRVHNII